MAIDSLKVKVVGTKKVRRELGDLVKQKHEGFKMALFLEGHDILRKSGLLVPVDFSNLKGTGTVKAVPGHRRHMVIISYGGPNAPYAVVQHERMDFKHTPPQSAKYLTIPFLAAVRTMGPRMAKRMKVLGRTAVTSSRSGGTIY